MTSDCASVSNPPGAIVLTCTPSLAHSAPSASVKRMIAALDAE